MGVQAIKCARETTGPDGLNAVRCIPRDFGRQNIDFASIFLLNGYAIFKETARSFLFIILNDLLLVRAS